MDSAAVKKKFGVPPAQIRDYLALVGDTSDNIPGVPKVGPKTAVKWLLSHQSVANIIQHADEFKGKVGENLRASLTQLSLSYQLVTLKLDVAIEETLEKLCMQEMDLLTLKKHYGELEFKTWLAQLVEQEFVGDQQEISLEPETLDQQGYSLANNPISDPLCITDWSTFERWHKKLQQADLMALKIFATTEDYMQAKILGLAMAVDHSQAAYIPFYHNDLEEPDCLSCDEVLFQLKTVLEDPKKNKVGHDIKYDAHLLFNHGIHLQGIAFDTMLESYVLSSTASTHKRETLAHQHLNYSCIQYETIAGKGVKQLSFDQIALFQASQYAVECVDIIFRLHHKLWLDLEQKQTLKKLFCEVELPLLSVLYGMEKQGVLVDAALLTLQSETISHQITQYQDEAYELAGEPFNMASPKQIQAILFDKMGLPVKAKTPKKQPSTSESVLQELAIDYPLPKLILAYRSLAKLKSTYTDKLPLQIDSQTDRVHTCYNQAIAVTGRLSSTDPNLQNIPIRTALGRQVRQAFIAPSGKKIVAADYSQIELRIMAHLSEDKGLLSAFEQGLDVHSTTAAEVFGVELESVSDAQRRSAKAINFGLIYGMSAFGLAKQLNIARNEAQGYIDQYFTRYPDVKNYMDQMCILAQEQGYVETVFGRRLYLPEINSRNHQRRQYAERSAINAPMQGSAADIIKQAMLTINQWLLKEAQPKQPFAGTIMTMQVHDELVFEIPEIKVDEAIIKITDIMSHATSLKVPLIVDVGVGDNWDQAH
jgi:DNA polymerase-1